MWMIDSTLVMQVLVILFAPLIVAWLVDVYYDRRGKR